MWIKSLKDSYSGKRCFIVATGPSLKISDLDLIKNEYSFGVNSCVLALDKTDWRPDFFILHDSKAWMTLKNIITAHPELKAAVADFVAKRYQVPQWIKRYPFHRLTSRMYHLKGYPSKFIFSDDCYASVYDGGSVVFTAMQFAVYMGFKEICLLGCDCNYSQEKKHFLKYEIMRIARQSSIDGERMIASHGYFKKFADSHGVKVINCTRGGMLEVYPRKPL